MKPNSQFKGGGGLLAFILFSTAVAFGAQPAGLQVSVYCTAGDVEHYLTAPEGRRRVLETMRPLGVTRLFLEGRRGDEYVAPQQLQELRAFFATNGIACSGGIATVPGANFGTRQQGELGWLNWESRQTQTGVAEFFTQNAPVFDELIVDDFFCTGDVSAASHAARGARSWGDYRRDLLVSLVQPMIVQPTRQASRHTKLIIKFPQWYDRFHLFGYDPPRMAANFAEVWVGTEVRNPLTRRMGFVQPTEGYMNFRWLTSIAGRKVRGAWFDHIECSAQNFVDQAYQSVLAGAGELTLFRLGDVMEGHPGDARLASRLPELRELAADLRHQTRRGIAFYKPPGSTSEDNLYLADYLGMIGLPLLPVAEYPRAAAVAILPVQAAHDPQLLERMRRHLRRGATVVVTPALLRALGAEAANLAGVEPTAEPQPAKASEIQFADQRLRLETPLELDARLKATGCDVWQSAVIAGAAVPLLTSKAIGPGRLCVLNLRTFSEEDFRASGEWLLPPRPLGLPVIPTELANDLRRHLLGPMKLDFRSPAGVTLVLGGQRAWLYSFRDESTQVQFNGKSHTLPPHGLISVR